MVIQNLQSTDNKKPYIISGSVFCSSRFSIYLKWSECCSVMSDTLLPLGLYSWWYSPGQNTGVGSLSLLQGIFPTQGLNPGLLHCSQILLRTKPHRKPKNTGVGSLSLLQWIFPTQRSNQGLLHCRWILYQLSYLGTPNNPCPWWKKEQQTIKRHSFIQEKQNRITCFLFHTSL